MSHTSDVNKWLNRKHNLTVGYTVYAMHRPITPALFQQVGGASSLVYFYSVCDYKPLGKLCVSVLHGMGKVCR